MTGDFSNSDQVKKDRSFSHINLTSLRIWKDKPGYWIYFELSSARKDRRVFYQRILNYKRKDSITIQSTGYKIINPQNYQNLRANIQLFEQLTLDSLQITKGCQVYYKTKAPSVYSGKTLKKSCLSNTKNIRHISSSLIVTKDLISIWTKGYSEKGKLVWGKIKGPYKYKRLVQED